MRFSVKFLALFLVTIPSLLSCAPRAGLRVSWFISDPVSRSLVHRDPLKDVSWENSGGFMCVDPAQGGDIMEALRR